MNIERLKANNEIEIVRYDHDMARLIDNTVDYLMYGRLKSIEHDDIQDTDFAIWKLSSYSEYTGSAVEMANYRALWEKVESYCQTYDESQSNFRGTTLPATFGIYQVHGGFNTRAIAIRVDCDLDFVWEAIEDCVEYVILDDEIHDEINQEIIDSNWESVDCDSYVAGLADAYPLWDFNGMNRIKLRRIFGGVARKEGINWEVEGTTCTYIDVDKIVEKSINCMYEFQDAGAIYIGEPGTEPITNPQVDDLEQAGQQVLGGLSTGDELYDHYQTPAIDVAESMIRKGWDKSPNDAITTVPDSRIHNYYYDGEIHEDSADCEEDTYYPGDAVTLPGWKDN